jgi:DNA helicase HerA-like ATPase
MLPTSSAPLKRRRLGVLIDGTFTAGLTIRLDPGCSTEGLRMGSFVVLEGDENLYFSMVSDMQLRATDASLLSDPPREASPFVRGALTGTSTYATVQVRPMLMMPKPDPLRFLDETGGPQPVRTIPMHFAALCEATDSDFGAVFGQEGGKNFVIGRPLTMDVPVCLKLDRFVERSTGIFGQSGTGKSMLARILLSGIIKTRTAVCLIFDMHNEYAFDLEKEDGKWVRGLRQLFGARVMVYSLDKDAGSRTGRGADAVLRIGLNQIEAEDVLLLAEELDLTSTARVTVGLLEDTYGADWLKHLLTMNAEEVEQFCDTRNAHKGALDALQRKLREIGRQDYVMEAAPFDAIDEMVAALDRGKHIVLQFGRHNRVLDYMLVANIVTRRIREKYQDRIARYEETKDKADRPRPLVICIEEAHKFLNAATARQTTFGAIAREMRKFLVTLLIIDQRPSGIDSEVMSQLGTRVTGKLTEEADIEAVLTGVGGRSFLRSAVESLDTKQEVLLIGHAVPMPVQVRSRAYDETFFQAMGAPETGTGAARTALADIEDLYPKGPPRRR